MDIQTNQNQRFSGIRIDEEGLKEALRFANKFHINAIGGSLYNPIKPSEVEVRGKLGSLTILLDPNSDDLQLTRDGEEALGELSQISISFFEEPLISKLILSYELRRYEAVRRILDSISISNEVPIVCNSVNSELTRISNLPFESFKDQFAKQTESLALDTFNYGLVMAQNNGLVPSWMLLNLNKFPGDVPYPSPTNIELIDPISHLPVQVAVRLGIFNTGNKEELFLTVVPPGMEDCTIIPPHVSEEDYWRLRQQITSAAQCASEAIEALRNTRRANLKAGKVQEKRNAIDIKFDSLIQKIANDLGIEAHDPILIAMKTWPDLWQKTLKSRDERTPQVNASFVGKEPQNVPLEDCFRLAEANVIAGAILNRKQKVSRSSEKGIRGVGILCDSWSRKFESAASSNKIASEHQEALPQLKSKKEILVKTLDAADGALDLFKSLTTKFETSSIGEILFVLDEMYGLFNRDIEEFLKQNNSVKEYRAYLENFDEEETLTDEIAGEIFGKGISELGGHFSELSKLLGSEDRAHSALLDFLGKELFNPQSLISNASGSIIAGVMLKPELPLTEALLSGAKKAIQEITKDGPVSLEEVLFAKKISWLLCVLSISQEEASESGSLMHRFRDFCFTKPDLANRAGAGFRDFRTELDEALERREFEVFGTPIPENGLTSIIGAIKELRLLGCEFSLPKDLGSVSSSKLREFMTTELPYVLEAHRTELETLNSELSEAQNFLEAHQGLSSEENLRISNEFKLLKASKLFVERAPRT